MSRQTLAGVAHFDSDVRKSRFLVQAAPVESPAAAIEWLASVSDADATHNCWAYRIGQQYRFSDDGEPSGTAGKPILAAIDGQQLDQAMVVVTRWFGGIKLGAGGLVRAYGGAAAECLRLAARRVLIDYAEAWLTCDFGDVTTAHQLLATHGGSKLDETYTEHGLRMRIRVPSEHLDALAATLRNATRGRAAVLRIEDGAGGT